jgi:arylsulfatase A-like enzyme
VYNLTTHIRTTMPNVVTLPQHFKNNGYVSVGMGKLFHNKLEDKDSYSVPHRYSGGKTYVTEANLELLKKAKERGRKWGGAGATECADVPDEAYSDGSLAAMAIQSLQELAPKAKAAGDRRQPFFLGVGFAKPHLPFCAPKQYWDLYDRSRIPLPYPDKPKNAPGIALTSWGELREYTDIPRVGPCDEAKTRELIHGYYACVSYLDANVGKLLAELDRLDLRKDTIILLWGDHGWKLGEYSMWCKHTNFELDTHVPLILSDPDLPKGVRVRGLTEFVDIYPTLCELCGLSLPATLEGSSMVPVMLDPKRPWKKAAFSQYPREGNIMGYSMRTDRYRYTEWQDRQSGEAKYRELYDLEIDPLCKQSIAAKPESQPLVAELHAMMNAGWRAARP